MNPCLASGHALALAGKGTISASRVWRASRYCLGCSKRAISARTGRSLGLVRSALHQPLWVGKRWLDFNKNSPCHWWWIEKRPLFTLQKRKKLIEKENLSSKPSSNGIIGPAPVPSEVHGRYQRLNDCLRQYQTETR